MKRKKLLKKLTEYFDMEARKRCFERKQMKELLRKMRKKERQLQSKFDKESNKEKRDQLSKQQSVVHAQRKKGIKMLKKMSCD